MVSSINLKRLFSFTQANSRLNVFLFRSLNFTFKLHFSDLVFTRRNFVIKQQRQLDWVHRKYRSVIKRKNRSKTYYFIFKKLVGTGFFNLNRRVKSSVNFDFSIFFSSFISSLYLAVLSNVNLYWSTLGTQSYFSKGIQYVSVAFYTSTRFNLRMDLWSLLNVHQVILQDSFSVSFFVSTRCKLFFEKINYKPRYSYLVSSNSLTNLNIPSNLFCKRLFLEKIFRRSVPNLRFIYLPQRKIRFFLFGVTFFNFFGTFLRGFKHFKTLTRRSLKRERLFLTTLSPQFLVGYRSFLNSLFTVPTVASVSFVFEGLSNRVFGVDWFYMMTVCYSLKFYTSNFRERNYPFVKSYPIFLTCFDLLFFDFLEFFLFFSDFSVVRLVYFLVIPRFGFQPLFSFLRVFFGRRFVRTKWPKLYRALYGVKTDVFFTNQVLSFSPKVSFYNFSRTFSGGQLFSSFTGICSLPDYLLVLYFLVSGLVDLAFAVNLRISLIIFKNLFAKHLLKRFFFIKGSCELANQARGPSNSPDAVALRRLTVKPQRLTVSLSFASLFGKSLLFKFNSFRLEKCLYVYNVSSFFVFFLKGLRFFFQLFPASFTLLRFLYSVFYAFGGIFYRPFIFYVKYLLKYLFLSAFFKSRFIFSGELLNLFCTSSIRNYFLHWSFELLVITSSIESDLTSLIAKSKFDIFRLNNGLFTSYFSLSNLHFLGVVNTYFVKVGFFSSKLLKSSVCTSYYNYNNLYRPNFLIIYLIISLFSFIGVRFIFSFFLFFINLSWYESTSFLRLKMCVYLASLSGYKFFIFLFTELWNVILFRLIRLLFGGGYLTWLKLLLDYKVKLVLHRASTVILFFKVVNCSFFSCYWGKLNLYLCLLSLLLFFGFILKLLILFLSYNMCLFILTFFFFYLFFVCGRCLPITLIFKSSKLSFSVPYFFGLRGISKFFYTYILLSLTLFTCFLARIWYLFVRFCEYFSVIAYVYRRVFVIPTFMLHVWLLRTFTFFFFALSETLFFCLSRYIMYISLFFSISDFVWAYRASFSLLWGVRGWWLNYYSHKSKTLLNFTWNRKISTALLLYLSLVDGYYSILLSPVYVLRSISVFFFEVFLIRFTLYIGVFAFLDFTRGLLNSYVYLLRLLLFGDLFNSLFWRARFRQHRPVFELFGTLPLGLKINFSYFFIFRFFIVFCFLFLWLLCFIYIY